MKAVLAGALALLVSCTVVSDRDHALQRTAMLNRAAASMVVVRVGDGHGSGTVIRSTPLPGGQFGLTVLSARHVTDGAPSIRIERHVEGSVDPLVSTATVVEVAPLNVDAVIVYAISPVEIPAAPLRHDPVVVGEDIYTMGFSGGGKRLWITHGLASAKDRGGAAAPGDSGGAMVDSEGRLVGVIVAIDSLGFGGLLFHHCHFIPIAELLPWIETIL